MRYYHQGRVFFLQCNRQGNIFFFQCAIAIKWFFSCNVILSSRMHFLLGMWCYQEWIFFLIILLLHSNGYFFLLWCLLVLLCQSFHFNALAWIFLFCIISQVFLRIPVGFAVFMPAPSPSLALGSSFLCFRAAKSTSVEFAASSSHIGLGSSSPYLCHKNHVDLKVS